MTLKPSTSKVKYYSQLIYYIKSLKQYLVLLALFICLLGSINILINQPYYQHKFSEFLKTKSEVNLEFENLHFNLFSGLISGKNLKADFKKTGHHFALDQFKIQFNPLYFFILKLKLSAIDADSIFVDIPNSAANDKVISPKPPSETLPLFLRRIDLNNANIQNLFLNRGSLGFLSIKSLELKSTLNPYLTLTPRQLEINQLSLVTPKVQSHIQKILLNGSLKLNFSEPEFFKKIESEGRLTITEALTSFTKKPKPWLTQAGWDKDLEDILRTYYPEPFSMNKSHLYLKSIFLNIKINSQTLAVTQFHITMEPGLAKGELDYNLNSKDIKIQLETESPLPFTKLPLGQAQIRKAFKTFDVKLNGSGQFKTLDDNHIKLKLEAKFKENQVNPEAGDLMLDLDTQFKNSVLITDHLTFKLKEGSLFAGGLIDLNKKEFGLKFKSEQMDIHTIVRLFSTINIPSVVDGSGYLVGDFKNPKLVAELISSNATYEFLNFGDAIANLKIENKNLELEVFTPSSLIGKSQLKLIIENVYQSFDQKLNLTSQFENLKIGAALANQYLEGTAFGYFNLKRANNQNQGQGEASLSGLSALGHLYGDLDFDFKLINKELDIKLLSLSFFDHTYKAGPYPALTFNFNDAGFQFKGEPLPSLKLQGQYLKLKKDEFTYEGSAKNFSLALLHPLIPIDILESEASLDFKGRYQIKEPWLSDFESKIKNFYLLTNEAEIELKNPAEFAYHKKMLRFKNFQLLHGLGDVSLNGDLGLEDGSQLKIKGWIDFNPWTELNPYITYTDKPLSVDLILKNKTLSPDLFGTIVFENDAIEFRKLPYDFDRLNGTLTFDGKKIASPDFSLHMSDSPLSLKGWIKYEDATITTADLYITGSEVPLLLKNATQLLTDIDIHLIQNKPLLIKGKINILQGEYAQNYGLANFIIKPKTTQNDKTAYAFDFLPPTTLLDIEMINSGDFLVKNNMAYLELGIDLNLKGTLQNPYLLGQIDFLNGKINSLGVYFDEASGFAEFTEEDPMNPSVFLKATTQIQNFSISANATGKFDNLKLLLDSNPSLDRKDIMSLLLYGQTSDQIVGNASDTFLQTAAITQLATVLSQPLSKLSGLDYFNVSQRQETWQEATQRISIGKSLTQRLNLAFTSDLNNEDPERAIEMGFQVFDAFSLIFAKDFSDRYRLDLNFRFESY